MIVHFLVTPLLWTHLNCELLSLEFEGQVLRIGHLTRQTVQTGQLTNVQETWRNRRESYHCIHVLLRQTLYRQKYWVQLVFGGEFLSQGLYLKSHQRCSAGIRPVKFFHTDWIIISLWFLSYTQRHCHDRIEKVSVQTVAIKLEAHNSLQYHYMLKH